MSKHPKKLFADLLAEYGDGEWDEDALDCYDPTQRHWKDANWQAYLKRVWFEEVRDSIVMGKRPFEPQLMESLPAEWRRELIEAICLRKVQPKEKS